MPADNAGRAQVQNGCIPPPPDLPEDAFEAALVRQREDWLAGRRIPAAERLAQEPALAADPERAAELIYHEFALRRELGEQPDWADYLRRFPEHALLLILMHRADEMVEQTLAPAEPVPPAEPLADYDILEEIGRGGMGVVYKARQKSLDRVVALKLIRAGEATDTEERQRFQREALALARSQHPNIVQVYEAGEADGRPFLALEFVAGGNLAKHLGGNPLPAPTAASLAEVLARAIDHAHRQGVIHRDLKPANILLQIADCRLQIADFQSAICNLQSAIPKVTDFGLAKRLDAAGDTRTGVVMGTPSYMAPEQAAGHGADVGPWTDVYGLGTILYELLTGRPPFRAESPLQTLQQVLQTEPAPPSLLNPAVPRDLETVCLKCLAKEPERRYPSAAALADDLARWQRGEAVQARRIGVLGRSWRWCRRRPAVASLVAALAAALVTVVVSTTLLWLKAEAARHETEASDAQVQELLSEVLRPGHSSYQKMHYYGTLPDIDVLRRAEAHLARRLEKTPDDLPVRRALTNLRGNLGTLYGLRGQPAERETCLQRARDLWEPLARREPHNREYREWLANTCYWQSGAADGQGQPGRALELVQKAVGLWLELAEEQPGDAEVLERLAGGYFHLFHCRDPAVHAAETRQALEEEKARLDQRIGADPTNLAVRKHLALTCLVLGDVHRGTGAPSQAAVYWRQAYEHYRRLPASPSPLPLSPEYRGEGKARDSLSPAAGERGRGEGADDPLATLGRAFCCSGLMDSSNSDAYYREAIALFGQAGRRLDALVEQHPGSDGLQHAQVEAYCSLVVCHWRAGRADRAEQALAQQVRPLVRRACERANEPQWGLNALYTLCRSASLLEEAKHPASVVLAREAAAVADCCVDAPSRDWMLSENVASQTLAVAAILGRRGCPDEALRQAEQARRLYAALRRAAPDLPSYGFEMSVAWERVGKIRWTLGRHDEALAAFRASAAVQREVLAQAPSVPLYRVALSRCYDRLVYWGGLMGDRATVADALHQREKLWPNNAEQLLEVSRDFQRLADAMGQVAGPPSPAEQAERQRYLAESERTRRAAEQAAHR
jgi:tetratricopeptide (TPR) repeat protein